MISPKSRRAQLLLRLIQRSTNSQSKLQSSFRTNSQSRIDSLSLVRLSVSLIYLALNMQQRSRTNQVEKAAQLKRLTAPPALLKSHLVSTHFCSSRCSAPKNQARHQKKSFFRHQTANRGTVQRRATGLNHYYWMQKQLRIQLLPTLGQLLTKSKRPKDHWQWYSHPDVMVQTCQMIESH